MGVGVGACVCMCGRRCGCVCGRVSVRVWVWTCVGMLVWVGVRVWVCSGVGVGVGVHAWVYVWVSVLVACVLSGVWCVSCRVWCNHMTGSPRRLKRMNVGQLHRRHVALVDTASGVVHQIGIHCPRQRHRATVCTSHRVREPSHRHLVDPKPQERCGARQRHPQTEKGIVPQSRLPEVRFNQSAPASRKSSH